MRSGRLSGEAFTVDIVQNAEKTSALAISLGVDIMPSSIYKLPLQVKIEEGMNSSSFNLSINKQALKTKAGKRLMLCIALANPSYYTLSETAAEVSVLVDVDKLKL